MWYKGCFKTQRTNKRHLSFVNTHTHELDGKQHAMMPFAVATMGRQLKQELYVRNLTSVSSGVLILFQVSRSGGTPPTWSGASCRKQTIH